MKKTRHNDYEEKVVFSVWAGYTVHIIFTESLVSSRFARYTTAGSIDDQTSALHSCTGDGHSHLFLSPEASAEVIAHEAFHAIWAILDWAGVEKYDNETLAYHLGHLVGHVSRFQAKVLDVKSKRGKKR